MAKRSAVNRKDTKRSRDVKAMIRRFNRKNTYTLIDRSGKVMRGRLIVRERTLALFRLV